MTFPVLDRLLCGVTLAGDLRADVATFLRRHGRHRTLDHSTRVTAKAKELAGRWYEDPERAEIAGWLHDVSAVIPPSERIPVAEGLRLDLMPEERLAPVLVHQKLSAYLASAIFGVTDSGVLSAIGCHTTLKADATALDKLLVVADKLEIRNRRDELVLHPWAEQAYQELKVKAQPD